MDGFHLSRAQLAALPNPTEALHHRGAPFSFDADAYASLVRAVRAPLPVAAATAVAGAAEDVIPPIHAPGFDHAVGDPVAGAVVVGTGARVLLFEGCYVGLREGAWGEARALMDEVWALDVAEEEAARRLGIRHFDAGLVVSVDEGVRRAWEVDMVNGRLVVEGRGEVDELIWGGVWGDD